MKTLSEIHSILSTYKEELRKRYKVKDIGIFGSYVRGEEEEKSDLDILVDFEKDAEIGLLEFVNMENYLSDLLGIKVDLVEKTVLKPRIGRNILKEVIYL